MNVTQMMQIVQTMGFPVAMCVAMGWFVYWQTKEHNRRMDDLHDKRREEMNAITTALNNNTIALTKLTDNIKKLQ